MRTGGHGVSMSNANRHVRHALTSLRPLLDLERAAGFVAPVWAAAFWLLGLGLVTRPLPAWPWVRAAYLRVAAFLVVHVAHAFLGHAAW